MKSSEDALRALLQRSFDGDRTAYREFLTQLSELLRTYVRRQLYRLGRAEHDAEDIVQEALLAIHGRWHTYDREVPVVAWARAIARYKLIDFLRATTSTTHDRSLDEVEDATSTDGLDLETSISLKKLVAALPNRMRLPIELVKLQGLSVKEAAAATGMTESAIKVNVHRGLKAVARVLRQ